MSKDMTTPVPDKARQNDGRAVRNVLSNWGAYIFSFTVSFFLAPFVVRHLGQTGYGIWTLLSSLTGYLGLLDLGVRGAVTRFVARHHAEADHEEASRIASSALLFFTAAAFLVIFASAVLALFVVQHFNIDQRYLVAARAVLVLSGANVGLTMINGVFGGVVVGLQRFDVTNRIEIATTGLRSLAIVAALSVGGGIVSLGCISVIFSLGMGFALVRAAFRLYPGLKIVLGRPDWKRLSTIFSFSIFVSLIHASLQLIWYTDSVVIGAFLPIAMVSYFAIASNLLTSARSFLSGISSTLTPMASSMQAVSKDEELRQLALNSARYANLVMLPMAITLLIRGKAFIKLWMGPDFTTLSGTVLIILTAAWVINAGNGVTSSILMGLSKHKPLALMAAGEGILNLALSIALVRHLGIYGVALGTTIPNLIQNAIVYPPYLCHVLKIPYRRYCLYPLARPVVAMIPFGLATYLIERQWTPHHLTLFFSQVVLALPFAFAGFWLCVLRPAERSRYYESWILPFLRSLGWSSAG